jgi:hypothetical protein
MTPSPHDRPCPAEVQSLLPIPDTLELIVTLNSSSTTVSPASTGHGILLPTTVYGGKNRHIHTSTQQLA